MEESTSGAVLRNEDDHECTARLTGNTWIIPTKKYRKKLKKKLKKQLKKQYFDNVQKNELND